MKLEFYELRRAGNPPWGDYGDVLYNGLRLARGEDGTLEYGRAGPFVPPVAKAGSVILRDDIKDALGRSDLTGWMIRPVVFSKCVKLPWTEWGPEMKREPKGGEPENFILCGKHDAKLCEALGPVWELTAKPFGCVPRQKLDIFATFASVPFNGYLVFSARAVEWFVRQVSCLQFERIEKIFGILGGPVY